MKQRNGFVSNSSSSSFIIGFNKDPMIRENLEAEMGECAPNYWDDVTLTTEDVVTRVWNDLVTTDPAQMNEIMKELRGSIPYSVVGRPEMFDFHGNDKYQEYFKATEAFEDNYLKTNKDVQKFLKSLEGKHVYILSYADENGEGELEHGNIFRNLEINRAISHH